eukprot:scaffold416989_cov20-Prasinocladus_malaysianus.AAC.1
MSLPKLLSMAANTARLAAQGASRKASCLQVAVNPPNNAAMMRSLAAGNDHSWIVRPVCTPGGLTTGGCHPSIPA